MNHIPLFFGPEWLHLAVRIVGYVAAAIMVLAVIISVEMVIGNGSRWLLRLLIWPMAAVTVMSLVVAEMKTRGYDYTDLLIYSTWFKVICLMAFWGIAQQRRGDHK